MIVEATITIRLTEAEYRTVAAALPPGHDEWRKEMQANPEQLAAILAAIHRTFAAVGMKPLDNTPSEEGTAAIDNAAGP